MTLDRISAVLDRLGPVAVAVSGGVDSMTLAVIANRNNPACRIYHAISPAVPGEATDRVRRYADKEGWSLNLIDAGEMDDDEYLANPVNRCYFCKTNLYDTVVRHTELTVVSGTNTDDLGDYRPGLTAAAEHAVVHPWVEAGIDKDTLRGIARSLGLNDLHDLPAAPCLSSRVTTGIAIDPNVLPLIHEVETAAWARIGQSLPLDGVRCRIRPEGLAIEVETTAELDDLADYALETKSITRDIFRKHGYGSLCRQISIEPYRRGSAFLIETHEVG